MPLSLKRERVTFGLQVILTWEFFWKALKSNHLRKKNAVWFQSVLKFNLSLSPLVFSVFPIFPFSLYFFGVFFTVCDLLRACDHLKSSKLSANTFKILLELRGSIPEPAIRSDDTGQQKHCFDSCQLIKTWMYNIRLQAPKLARKCEIKHWYACGADGRNPLISMK